MGRTRGKRKSRSNRRLANAASPLAGPQPSEAQVEQYSFPAESNPDEPRTHALDDRQADSATPAKATAPEPSTPSRNTTGSSTSSKRDPGERVRRTLRLSPRTNTMVEELAAARGIDVNTTIAVAIAEDYFRLFGSTHK